MTCAVCGRPDDNQTGRSDTTVLCLCIRCNKKPRMAMSLVCEECWDTAPWQETTAELHRRNNMKKITASAKRLMRNRGNNQERRRQLIEQRRYEEAALKYMAGVDDKNGLERKSDVHHPRKQ